MLSYIDDIELFAERKSQMRKVKKLLKNAIQTERAGKSHSFPSTGNKLRRYT